MAKRAARAKMPDFVPPCLAKLGAEPPEGPNWGHEIKFDGYRLQACIEKGRARLLTRNGLDWTDRFGRLAAKISALPVKNALIDGEAIVEDEHGRSDFSALVHALKSNRRAHIVYVAFDVLFLDGRDLISSPLSERKAKLKQVLQGGLLRYSDHLIGNGAKMLSEACKLGLEGIVSKRLDAPYHSGRGELWRKTKCYNTDEFVIIGYLDSTALKDAVGALVLGYFENKKLRYVGRVGTGFDHRTATTLWQSLQKHKIASTEVSEELDSAQRKDVRWVSAKLVAQIEYRGWTQDGLLRHASFKALREDKHAHSVRHP